MEGLLLLQAQGSLNDGLYPRASMIMYYNKYHIIQLMHDVDVNPLFFPSFFSLSW